MARTWSLLAALLLATAALAGCTGSTDDPPAASPPADDGGSDAPSGSPGGSAPGGSAEPPASSQPAPPAVEPVEATGKIEGPFEKEWTLDVPTMGFKQADLTFRLTGVEAGAPPTARVYLAFLNPDGTEVKHAIVGLSGAGDEVTWTFGNADMLQAGEYKIKVTAEPTPAGAGALPSFGLAQYELHAAVHY